MNAARHHLAKWRYFALIEFKKVATDVNETPVHLVSISVAIAASVSA
jgi:hypothetical protein